VLGAALYSPLEPHSFFRFSPTCTVEDFVACRPTACSQHARTGWLHKARRPL